MSLSADFLAPFADAAAALDRLLPDGRRGVIAVGPAIDPASLPAGARVRLEAEPTGVLLREIARPGPEVAPDRRAAWIEARLEELSPWAPGAFLWAELPGGEALRLALTAAAPIRAFEAALKASGRRLVEVQIGAARLSLDPEGQARRVRRLALYWSGAVGICLLVAALALWQIAAAGQVSDLARQRLARFAAEAAAQSDRSRAVLALAGGREKDSLTPPLNRLAAGLPLDSYLQTLRLTATEFQIAGQSVAPDAIVPALEAGGFRGVDFAGASALDAATGLYTFTIHGRTGGAP